MDFNRIDENFNSPSLQGPITYSELAFFGYGVKLHTGNKVTFGTTHNTTVFPVPKVITADIGFGLYNTVLPITTGEIVISLVDTVNKIISGTFSFTATNSFQNKIIAITEGRFDGKYK